MSVEIRHFQRGDAGKVETTKPVSADRDAYYYEGIEELGRTMVEDGKPIAAWGMQPHWDGVASVWSELSERALTKHKRLLAKSIKMDLKEHIVQLKLHRIQVIVPDKDHVTKRWIEWLGFHAEGRLEQYMKGVDVWIYARLVH